MTKTMPLMTRRSSTRDAVREREVRPDAAHLRRAEQEGDGHDSTSVPFRIMLARVGARRLIGPEPRERSFAQHQHRDLPWRHLPWCASINRHVHGTPDRRGMGAPLRVLMRPATFRPFARGALRGMLYGCAASVRGEPQCAVVLAQAGQVRRPGGGADAGFMPVQIVAARPPIAVSSSPPPPTRARPSG